MLDRLVNGTGRGLLVLLVAWCAAGCGGRSERQASPDAPWPANPIDVAPALDPSGVTGLSDAVAFLYTGDAPIQADVAPGAIVAKRVAVLRGRVLDEAGQALSGVRVDVAGRPELGWTESRTDGRYDLVVNGGEHLVLRLRLDGRVAAQRRLWVPWQDYLAVPEVRLVARSDQVAAVDLSAGARLVRAPEVSDASGTRRAGRHASRAGHAGR